MSRNISASFSAHFTGALPPNSAFSFQKEAEGQEEGNEERKVEKMWLMREGEDGQADLPLLSTS